MRNPKYYINGAKGKIQVSKGSFLTMEKRKKEKKRTEKEKLLPANRFLMKQKAINKKEKNYPNSSFLKKNPNLPQYDNFYGDVKLQEKQCTNTIESQKTNFEDDMMPCVSDFSLGFQDEMAEQFTEKSQQTTLNHFEQPGFEKSNFDHFLMPFNFTANEVQTDNQEYYSDQRECQDSTWSVINQNVQALSLSLSLSVYDHLYGYIN